jgi:hypothetical protein
MLPFSIIEVPHKQICWHGKTVKKEDKVSLLNITLNYFGSVSILQIRLINTLYIQTSELI